MNGALLVIDTQNALVDDLPPDRRTELLGAIGTLVQRARGDGTRVVYVRHNEDEGPLRLGTREWEIAAEIAPREGEPIVEKRHTDSFHDTDLADVLAAHDIDALVLCGMQSDFCVGATARGAIARGYRVTLAADAHATYAAGGKSEREIIDEVHADLRARNVAVTMLRALAGAILLATLPQLARADTTTTIVRPLREIGHVTATSAFCKEFAQGGGPAAAAALAFENRLYLTGNDLASFDTSSPLGAHRSGKLLEDDLHVLADDALAGRAELAALREKALASPTPANQAVVDFADALSGAQGRQMDLARHIARIVGTLQEAEFSSIVNSPLDAHYANAFGRSPSPQNALLDDPLPGSESVFVNNFFSTPGDDLVGRDLARAVEHAHEAETLENCI